MSTQTAAPAPRTDTTQDDVRRRALRRMRSVALGLLLLAGHAAGQGPCRPSAARLSLMWIPEFLKLPGKRYMDL